MRNPLRKARNLVTRRAPSARLRPGVRTTPGPARNPLRHVGNSLLGPGGPARTPKPVNPLRSPAGRTPPRGRRPRKSPLNWLSDLGRTRRIR